ncbi:MAG: 50S ribosomal protein L9, partial [Coriobacteriales bacterium]|nr:50S ribosomal protein L9 [Coriobacteriales bacterium]
ATPGNLKQLELRKHNIAKREADRLDTADKLVAALDGQTVLIAAKVGEEGQLFGSVTPVQVATAINERFGTDIDRKRIDLHGAIKAAGLHTASISIYRDVKATVTIEVVDEKTAAASEADSVAEELVAEGLSSEEAAEVAEDAEAAAGAAEGVDADAAGDVAADAAVDAVADAAVDAAEVEFSSLSLEEQANIADEALAEGLSAEEAAEVVDEVEGAIDAAIADAVVAEVAENLENPE